MRMITTKAVAIWLGRVLGAGQMGTLYAQSIKTGPEVGQQVPAFAAQDHDGRHGHPAIDHGAQRGDARLLPFRRLVTF
jgi:hypothetical protein